MSTVGLHCTLHAWQAGSKALWCFWRMGCGWQRGWLSKLLCPGHVINRPCFHSLYSYWICCMLWHLPMCVHMLVHQTCWELTALWWIALWWYSTLVDRLESLSVVYTKYIPLCSSTHIISIFKPSTFLDRVQFLTEHNWPVLHLHRPSGRPKRGHQLWLVGFCLCNFFLHNSSRPHWLCALSTNSRLHSASVSFRIDMLATHPYPVVSIFCLEICQMLSTLRVQG